MTRFRERSEEFELLWPAVGDELFHFRVRRELGRGAFARVFLAEQVDLAGRLVVLKVSALDDDEAQTLAQLQHTNIVPIYSVHEDARLGLRAVCMPYFGGASLADVLQRLWERTGRPTHGAQLVAALEQAQAQAPPATEAFLPRAAGQTPLQLLGRLSYVRAVAWIVARLAEGLQHAHERGVLHRDIKPSNTLLGADGQPMLLDFNLARRAHHDEAGSSAIRGGTVAYMAPEHLRALAARDPRFDRLVDHRSDIYSLGMVLYEMLAREGPFEQRGSYSVLPALIELMALERGRALPSLRPKRPDASWTLESIVRKCLAPEPEQRYQQASHLAEDLRCFLDDRTLRHAPELSLVERLRKWVRRHPRLTSIGLVATVAAVLLAGTGAGALGMRGPLATARQAAAFLGPARARGFGQDRAASDPDLHAARQHHPEFDLLLKKAGPERRAPGEISP